MGEPWICHDAEDADLEAFSLIEDGCWDRVKLLLSTGWGLLRTACGGFLLSGPRMRPAVLHVSPTHCARIGSPLFRMVRYGRPSLLNPSDIVSDDCSRVHCPVWRILSCMLYVVGVRVACSLYPVFDIVYSVTFSRLDVICN